MIIIKTVGNIQLPPVTILPIFLSLPLFVKGIPIFLEIPDLNAEIPTSLFHEKPPKFIFRRCAIITSPVSEKWVL